MKHHIITPFSSRMNIPHPSSYFHVACPSPHNVGPYNLLQGHDGEQLLLLWHRVHHSSCSLSYKKGNQIAIGFHPNSHDNSQCTLLQGGCKSKNQCLQILIRYTFPCSKWRITLEKVQNWSLYSFKSAYWKDTFLSFTSKIWSKLRNSIILVFM